MMSPVRTQLFAIAALLCAACAARAATPKEIQAAIEKGTAYLKKSGGQGGNEGRDKEHVGSTALAGLALLEAGVPADDAAVKKITERIRDASFTENRTYQVALCILYLDRLGEPADRPLIQMLGVRLAVGQNVNGGWTYECVPAVTKDVERALRTRLGEAVLTAGKKPANPPTGTNPPAKPPVAKLHADVEKYGNMLAAADKNKNKNDDNSNTQFGVIGIWVARKHGVPVEPCLDLIEKRFLLTQTATGGWPYSANKEEGSPSMTCAGLLGLAVAIGRREERTLRTEGPKPPAKKDEPAKPTPPPGTDPNDPFYNPPPPKKSDEPKKEPPKKADPPKAKPADPRDVAVKRALDNLADALDGDGKGKRGKVRELYFLWSLERVGVLFGVEKIGKTDWYEYGSNILVRSQKPDGSWQGGHGADVDTAFAILFLSRSNLTRDLAGKVQKDALGAELRGGGAFPGGNPAPAPMSVDPPAKPPVTPVKPPVDPAKPPVDPVKPPADPKPPAGTTSAEIATELFRATGANWTATLQRVRDAKGPENTSALLAVIPLLDGDRQKQAREALAERLCRMNATTLRGMLKADDAELRRAAALACGMKEDKDHVADLIAALEDKDKEVAKAVRAALKSLTGKDFATAAQWKEWHAKEKK